MKLTDSAARTLPRPANGRAYVIYYDDEIPGYGLRVTKAGARAFILNYRVAGIERRLTIGTFMATPQGDGITEKQARRRARSYRDEIRVNRRDPVLEDRQERGLPTVAELAARYLETHAPKKRTSEADKWMLEKYVLPKLRNMRVAEVQFEDIDGLHRKITKAGAPTQANRVVALLSKMFALAIKWRMRSDNPAKGVERNPEERRQRYLTRDELSRLSATLAKHKNKASANAIRLLLLTGARRGEVLGATWDQFDLSAGVWTKPSAHTKQKREHRVPLSGPARQLLAEMYVTAESATKKDKKEISPYVFPSSADGKAQGDLKHFWASTCTAAEISGVRVHDLRHTYASVLASGGQSLPIIGQLLGHTNPNTTARYAHLFDDPLRTATERAAKTIAPSATAKSGRVVKFPKAATHD